MIKKKVVIVVSVLAVIIVALGITAMALWLPRSVKKIVPNETDDIIKIVEIPVWASQNEYQLYEKELDSAYYGEFVKLARSTKYIQYHNIMGWKCTAYPSVKYVIYYKSGLEIIVTDAYYSRNDQRLNNRYYYMTVDPFPEIAKLFEEHSIA